MLQDLRKLPKCYAVKIQQVAIRGTPDILVCFCGLFIALELKRNDRVKPDPLQLHELSKIEKAGGVSLVVTPSTWPMLLKNLDCAYKKATRRKTPVSRKESEVDES